MVQGTADKTKTCLADSDWRNDFNVKKKIKDTTVQCGAPGAYAKQWSSGMALHM